MTAWFRWVRARHSSHLDCKAVAELLQQYLDDMIDEDLARQISAHLGDCRRCGLEGDDYRQLKAALGARRHPISPEAVQRLRRFGQNLSRDEEVAGQ